MSLSHRPALLDFIPKTRRGHGATRKPKLKNQPVCVNPTCHTILGYDKNGKRRGELHEDQAANVHDWKEDHGFSGDEFKHTSFEDCIRYGKR